MTKKVLVPIAPGTEEMEAITIIDMMVRAGYQTVIASADFEGQLAMKGVARRNINRRVQTGRYCRR